MRLLFVVGVANDVFIYNLAKWLKSSIDDLTLDIFEFYPLVQQGYSNQYYDSLDSPKGNRWFEKIKGVRKLIQPFYEASQLDEFLKDKQYDIIQCHWIVPQVVLSKHLKEHCQQLCFMFWGGEFEVQTVLFSKKLYLRKLFDTLKEVDYITNSSYAISSYKKDYPQIKCKYQVENLGSSAMEELYKLSEKETKDESKKLMEMPLDKKSVLIGYSGKTLHNHLGVIKELAVRDDLKGRIHLLAPMTRGAADYYIAQVEEALQNSGYTYTLLKNCFLTDTEVARLRNATDIVLQMSDFDGYSRSIVECLSASAIMIYGDWLDYKVHLDSDGFTAIKTESIHKGMDVLNDVLNDYQRYADAAAENRMNGKRYLWSECIKDWVNFYRKIC